MEIKKNRNTLSMQSYEMFRAIDKHDYDSIVALLDDSPELLDKHDGSNYTPLHKAVDGLDPTVVSILLARGANQQLRRSKYGTALDLAMSLDNVFLEFSRQKRNLDKEDQAKQHQILRLLVEHGADPFETLKSGRSLVRYAIYRGNADLIRLIFSHYPDDLDEWCYREMTPLGLAIDYANEVSVRTLCEVGADPEDGYLMFALGKISSHPHIARALIEAGADVNRKDDREGKTCLHRAAFFDYVALATVLLECNAQVNLRNGLEETALTIAAENNSETMVRLLLSYGADVHAANRAGVTALYRTAKQLISCRDTLEYLKTRSQWDYNSAIAERQRTFEIVRLLLEAGADPDAPDVSGITPIHVAIGEGNYEIAALLLPHSKHYHVDNPETMSEEEMETLFDEAMRANPNCRDREGFDSCHKANTSRHVLRADGQP